MIQARARFSSISRHGVARVLLLLAAIATVALSGRTFLREYRLAFLLSGTANQQIEALSSSETAFAVPESPRSMRDALTACGRLLRFAPRIKAEPALRPAVASSCSSLAEAILERSPSNARARAVALLAGHDRSAEALRLAQVSGPYEPWPLSMRLSVIGEFKGSDAAWAAAAALDVGRALESHWGRDEVASLYVDEPGLRPLILRSAETLPSELQSSFLERVRRLSRGSP